MLLSMSTLGQHRILLGNVQKVQQDLFDLQRQVSSGKQADSFTDLNVRVEVVTALETKIRNGDKYIDSNNVILSRLNSMDISLGALIDEASEIKNVIQTARSATELEYPIFEQSLQRALEVSAGLLNENIAGRYLFSGSKTSIPPVVDPVTAPLIEGTADAGYYQGDTVDLTAQLSESLEINYNIRADEQGFQDLFGAMHAAILGLQRVDDDLLVDGMDLINSALDEIVGLRSRVQNNITIVEAANDSHSTSAPYYKQFLSDEIDTDVVAATTQVALNETILQASFQTFARISGLSLTDFL